MPSAGRCQDVVDLCLDDVGMGTENRLNIISDLQHTGGTIYNVFPSKYAIGIQLDSGKELLVHFGVNILKLKGKGFEVLVAEGDRAQAGQPILRVDLESVKELAPSIMTPIIFTNLPEGQNRTRYVGRTLYYFLTRSGSNGNQVVQR